MRRRSSLVALRGTRDSADKQKVVEYLRSGMTLVMSPGRDEDVLDPSKSAGSASVLTDGVFVWPKTLAYYLDTYDVGLPAAFELHMQRNKWKVPDDIERLGLKLPRYS